MLSSNLTKERLAFLERVGVPLLTTAQKKAIGDIASSELGSPREFMLRYGQPIAVEFLRNSAIQPSANVQKCNFPAEDSGSLFEGQSASCSFSITVRGNTHSIGAWLKKKAGEWKISSLDPQLFAIRDAYPPRRTEATPQAAAPAATQYSGFPSSSEYIESPSLPPASWEPRSEPESLAGPAAGVLSQLIPFGSVLCLIFVIVFIIVMNINFRTLRKEVFVPEWLEGEQQLEEVEIPQWWSRVRTRLTNRRIVQIRLSWLLSRRRIQAIALEDVHSVVWRRYTNWFLLVIGAALLSKVNAAAMLLLMLGLEAKILAIRFNTPFAQMPWTYAKITSFSRKHFDELARFYKKAQIYWAQVRTQKELPVPRTITVLPEVDKDFFWGRAVWIFVSIYLLLAILRRFGAPHITLDNAWGGLVLGLPVAVACRNRRDGMWSGILGMLMILAVKVPGSWLPGDGSANYFQYAVLLAYAAAAALISAALSRISPALGLAAPLLWVFAVAIVESAEITSAMTA